MASRLVNEISRRMKLLGLDMAGLSEKAGLKETYVKDIIYGRSKNPTASRLTRVAKALGCTVADLTGERPAATARNDDNIVSIPELDVHVAAGLGTDDAQSIMHSEEESAVVGLHTYPLDSFREAYGTAPGKIRIIPVRGNSMEPELWSGQRVMVDIEDQMPSPPGVFVVWDGLGLVLKYVEVVPNSDPVRVRISSAHPAFKPYERNLEEAYINGRVIGVWKRM